MPTQADVSDIIKAVTVRLEKAARAGVHLQVSEHRLDDDWLYVVVTPAQAGTRASDHARLLSQIERELREQEHIEQVLLVPAIDD